MPLVTNYEPFDGDYIDDDYGKFITDMQMEAGYDFGEYLEICVSLESDHTIRILGSNEEGDKWILDQCYPIPQGWELDRVQKMFEGNVYLQPSTRAGGK